MKHITLLLLFLVSSNPIFALDVPGFTCKAIPVQDRLDINTIPERRFIVIHNLTKGSIWLTPSIETPNIASSELSANHWSVFGLRKSSSAANLYRI